MTGFRRRQATEDEDVAISWRAVRTSESTVCIELPKKYQRKRISAAPPGPGLAVFQLVL